MNTLMYSFLTTYAFLFTIPIWVEICMIHDMVKTITNPMERSDTRANFYYIFIVIMQSITLTLYACANYEPENIYITVTFIG